MGRPSTLPEPWLQLATSLGGVGKLAEAMGTTPKTINRWAKEETKIRGYARILFLKLCKEHNI